MKISTLFRTAVLLTAFIGTTLTATAYSFEVDGIYYNKNSDGVSVSVTYRTTSSGGSYSGNVTIPSKVTYDNKSYAVTSIGKNAFYNSTGLTSVTIPNSVTSIGEYAFKNCSGLTSATIGESVTSIGNSAFEDCSGLTSVFIPNSVTSIGEHAFKNCSSMTSASIGESVASIGVSAFQGCTALTKLNYNAITCSDFDTYSYPDRYPPFYNLNISTIIIGNSVKTIPAYFAYSLSQLSSISIPNSVTSIGNYVFQNCSSMTRATIGSSVKSIGYCAFYYCSKLSNITIPNSVISIGESAFYGCTSMTSATIGNSVSSIERSTFYGCTALKRVIIGNSVNSMKDNVFMECKNLTQVICKANMPPKYEPYYDGTHLFEEIVYQNAILYVPDLTYNYYTQTEPWKNFMEIKTESYSDDGISFATSIYPTSIRMEAVDITGTQQANAYFTFEGTNYNPLVVTGLEPTNIYSGTYTLKTANGTTVTPFKFYTSELNMVPEGAKMLTETTALLKAETNMADEETICGFDWRRLEGPDDYLGTRVYCPVYDGTMAGTLKNLAKDTFYKYRPFYKSKANNVYYGDWVTFYTGDVGVEFDPVVYTYSSPEVTQNSAILQGVALRGSDEITEQGFEYWRKNGNVNKVTATGERMSATVTGLQPGTSYIFRAYVKAGGKTSYGANVDFVTVAGGLDVNADGVVNIADINVIINYILSGNQSSQGDVNGDGVVNIGDVNLIINEILSH